MIMMMITSTYRAHINIHLPPGTQERLLVQLEKSAELRLPQQVLAGGRLHHVHPDLLEYDLELLLVT